MSDDPKKPDDVYRPQMVILRYGKSVYLLEGDQLGDPLPYEDNEWLYGRTYESPFLEGLSFAGAYNSASDIGSPSGSESGDVVPPPRRGGG